MKNRNVGYLIVGISLVIGIIILIFNLALKGVVSQTCDHGSSCSMYSTISTQTYLSLAIAGFIFLIGIFLIFAKENEKIILKTKTIKEKSKKINIEKLNLDKKEREVIRILQEENKVIFQKTLMERLSIGKVGMTRLLDKLEAKQLIERKRRGMNNVIVLRH